MLLDKQNVMINDILLSAIPAGASTPAGTGTDVIDLLGGGTAQSDVYGAALSDITPNVDDVEVLAIITDAAAAGGTSLQLQLVTGATASPTTVVHTTGAIATAALVLGYRFALAIPPGFQLGRYLGVAMIQAGTAFTGNGRLHVSLVPRGGQQTAQTP